MNVFSDQAAPYLLVILVSMLTWAVGGALERLDDTRLVSFETNISTDNLVRVKFTNYSTRLPIDHGQFQIRCILPANTYADCIKSMHDDSSQRVKFLKGAYSANVSVNPQVMVELDMVILPAAIPPLGSSEVEFAINPKYVKDIDFEVIYNIDASALRREDYNLLFHTPKTPFFSKITLIFWLVPNYLMILFFLSAISFLLLITWIGTSLVRHICFSTENNSDSGNLRVEVELKNEKNE